MMSMTEQDWIGQQISSYKIVKVLGSGGMGVVFLGEHVRLETKVAIKLINVPNITEELISRFEGEAKALVSLSGIKGIADFLEFTIEPLALITKFIDGQDLEKCFSKEPDMGNVDTQLKYLDVTVKIVEALVKAHEKGVIHRDLKPENIMMAPEGPQLIDFGISQIRKKEGEAQRTTAESYMGTIWWAAPELLRTPDKINASVDVFSAHLMLYKIFNGQDFYGSYEDYSTRSNFELIKMTGRILQDSAEVERRLSHIYPEVAQIIREGISFDLQERRIKTMVDLRDACHAVRSTIELRKKGLFRSPAPQAFPLRVVPPGVTATAIPQGASTPPGTAHWCGTAGTASPSPTKNNKSKTTTLGMGDKRSKEEKLKRLKWTLISLISVVVCAVAGTTLYLTISPSTAPSRTTPSATTSSTKARKAKAKKVKLVTKKPVPPKPTLPEPLAKGQRPSSAYITHLYKKWNSKCRKTLKHRNQLDKPHLYLGCLRWYAEKLSKKAPKDFDRVALAILTLDEARAHFCFYKRQNVCGKGKGKRFLAKRRGLINECKLVAHKIGARRRRKGSKLKRLTVLMSGPQRKKINSWLNTRKPRRQKIRKEWVKSQPPDRMLCFKKQR